MLNLEFTGAPPSPLLGSPAETPAGRRAREARSPAALEEPCPGLARQQLEGDGGFAGAATSTQLKLESLGGSSSSASAVDSNGTDNSVNKGQAIRAPAPFAAAVAAGAAAADAAMRGKDAPSLIHI